MKPAPSVDNLPAVCRATKGPERFEFFGARPVAGFNLAEDEVGTADADDVPGPQARGAPGTGIPRRFQNPDRTVFVFRALPLGIHAGTLEGDVIIRNRIIGRYGTGWRGAI